MVWMVFLTPIFFSTLFFSYDIGRLYENEGIHQTAADSLALTGVNVIRRVFYRETATSTAPAMTPKEKADAIVAAIFNAAANMGYPIECQDIIITYCPKSSEPADADFNGDGPCYQPDFSSNCSSNPTPSSYITATTLNGFYKTDANPDAFYPLLSEMLVNAPFKASYLHIAITYHSHTFFSKYLTQLDFPARSVSAMARAAEEPDPRPCPGYFSNFSANNDPQTIRLRTGSQLIVNDGGILIAADPNLIFSSSGSENSVDAAWIEAVGTNASGQISYCCEYDGCCDCAVCPRLGVSPTEIEPSIPDPPTFDSNVEPCSNPIYRDTASNLCDTYKVNGRLYYINCEVTQSSYPAIITRATALGMNCAGGLCPGTYCGGVTISSIPDAADLVLNPVISGGIITDNVYYFVERNGRLNELRNADDSGATFYNRLRPGYILINDSYLSAEDGNLADFDGGVYLYAKEASGSGFSLDMVNSELRGSLLIWASHSRLTNSTLSYSPYTEGVNPCTPLIYLRTYLVL